jgi:hypothetical protein
MSETTGITFYRTPDGIWNYEYDVYGQRSVNLELLEIDPESLFLYQFSKPVTQFDEMDEICKEVCQILTKTKSDKFVGLPKRVLEERIEGVKLI